MGEKIYKFQLLLGDYVQYHTLMETRSGYVIGIDLNNYYILDLNNKRIYVEQADKLKIVSEDTSTITFITLKDRISTINRKMSHSSEYICKKLCTGLREFNEACSDYCPCRRQNQTYDSLPGDKIGSLFIGAIGFIEPGLLCGIRTRTILTEDSRKNVNNFSFTFDDFFDILSGSFPKPNPPYKDRSIEGVVDILNNPNYYKIYQRTYYLLSSDKGVIIRSWDEINENFLISNSYFSINPKNSPSAMAKSRSIIPLFLP
jgi:hypothetical protein